MRQLGSAMRHSIPYAVLFKGAPDNGKRYIRGLKFFSAPFWPTVDHEGHGYVRDLQPLCKDTGATYVPNFEKTAFASGKFDPAKKCLACV